jgi:hypothetical protein
LLLNELKCEDDIDSVLVHFPLLPLLGIVTHQQ